ncbi:hypothetical protein JHL17_36050 [Azospirillum sp. YIM B02556]|uniref:Uncharacterized protein n=1 Tax=Azospirillum endophyticum TaxID=2800326 RepID=A0ABS1FHB3_9PROT|nr:hypothetical protein [Azospirillum endophyticum]MBK1842820.1 hypothetical protein [Azospirillum endophyticum]
MIAHAIEQHAAAPENGIFPPVDMEVRVPVLAGSERLMGFAINSNHPDTPTWLVEVEAQSAFESDEAFLHRLRSVQHHLEQAPRHSRYHDSDRAVVALTLTDHAARYAMEELGFHRKFTVEKHVPGDRDIRTHVRVLSYSID